MKFQEGVGWNQQVAHVKNKVSIKEIIEKGLFVLNFVVLLKTKSKKMLLSMIFIGTNHTKEKHSHQFTKMERQEQKIDTYQSFRKRTIAIPSKED